MEIVCKSCGTVNNDKNMMCMRCGANLNADNFKDYEKVVGKVINYKLLLFLLIVILGVYLYFSVFYFGPWLNNILLDFGNSFIFDFYNNTTLTKVVLELIYIISLFLINYLVIAFSLIFLTNKRVIKREKINMFCFLNDISLVGIVILLTLIKFKFDYLLILEHLISLMAIFPYIKRKMLKRSI